MWSAVHRRADIAGASGHSHTTPDSQPSGTWLEGANVRPAGGIMTVKENRLSYTVREFDFSIACLFGTAQSGSILRMYPKDEGIPRAAQPDLVKSRRLVQLRISRWQLSITRYQGLLKPKLDETERQEIQTLLQEEKLSLKRHALKAN
jgi:hypothetical protein